MQGRANRSNIHQVISSRIGTFGLPGYPPRLLEPGSLRSASSSPEADRALFLIGSGWQAPKDEYGLRYDKPVTRNPDDVVIGGKVVGGDRDPFIRSQMLRGYELGSSID